MGDVVDFCIHVSTPLDKVATMKRRIIEYIERKNELWHAAPMVILKHVEELNKVNILAHSGGGTNQPSSPLTWTIEAPSNGRGALEMQRNGLKMTGENRKVSGMKQWFGEGETEAQFQTVVFCELGSEMEAEIWVLKCDADGWRCASNGA
ncbi:hypothetical protein LR48_Vigan03g150900 [Vigna angularis]|uniref:Uncharacterized protein n=1 Tax=Phaseolus angularis TaxID=3914 RepID=A0A0L9U645_PHAAN|nr:hypothetical protein LR48_Vigan03g150900 [Vigna angularis]